MRVLGGSLKFSALLEVEGILFSNDKKGRSGGVELADFGGQGGGGQSIG